MKKQRSTKILSLMAAITLCVMPELAGAAQQNSQSVPQSQPNAAPAPSNSQSGASTDQAQQGNPESSGTTVDPTKAPLQPVTTYPEAPIPQLEQTQNASQPATTTTTEPAPQTQKPASEPVGAAAAEKVPTAGGAASKPAGEAIAPAKQHQMRSLVIKVGAIAAGGLAAGTIYALSHSTSSKPPGTGQPGATQK